MADTLDRKNKKAEELNPSHSGVRSGNPQLDPDSARDTKGEVTDDKPHAPPAHGKK
jgi:hypothetical protein